MEGRGLLQRWPLAPPPERTAKRGVHRCNDLVARLAQSKKNAFPIARRVPVGAASIKKKESGVRIQERRVLGSLGNTTPLEWIPPNGAGLGDYRAILLRRVASAQPITIDEEYARQKTPIINAEIAMGLGEEGFQTRLPRVRQPEENAHFTANFSYGDSELQSQINSDRARPWAFRGA